MPEATVSAPPIAGSASPAVPGARRLEPIWAAVRRRPGISIGATIVAFSALLVAWARTRPGFDPYGWLVWGHQTLHLHLNTNGAPSWKPLPYLFTVPYALAGVHELQLWMVTSAAISLSGMWFAARLAYRLTAAPAERRWAGIVAGLFAACGLLGIQNYMHYILSSQSDPMIVTLCLAAIDQHLAGRTRTAFAMAVLASLGRPEAWPFTGLYLLWAWRARPQTRPVLIAGTVVIPALWFGIPWITADSPFVAGNLALHSGRAVHGNLLTGTLSRFFGLNQTAMQLAALLAVALAALRRDRTVLVIAAGAAAWVAIEVGFVLHGWPGIARYMFEASGVLVVLAGVTVGWLLDGSLARLGPKVSERLMNIGGPVLVALLLVALLPAARSAVRLENRDLHAERNRSHNIAALRPLIASLGGLKRIHECGPVATTIEFQSVLAFTTGANVSSIGYYPTHAYHHQGAQVLFKPQVGGWHVFPIHVSAAARPYCHGLRRVVGSRA
jgi:hypothetical protein